MADQITYPQVATFLKRVLTDYAAHLDKLAEMSQHIGDPAFAGLYARTSWSIHRILSQVDKIGLIPETEFSATLAMPTNDDQRGLHAVASHLQNLIASYGVQPDLRNPNVQLLISAAKQIRTLYLLAADDPMPPIPDEPGSR